MKILFFSRSLAGGGAERVLTNLASGLVSIGYDIFIAVNENKISYHVDERAVIISAPKINLGTRKNLFARFVRRLRRNYRNSLHTKHTIKSVKPDVVVSFMHCNLLSILMYHGKIPIVHSEHNAYDRNLGCRSFFNRFILNRFFNKVCVLSHFDQGYAVAKGLKNVVYMPNPNSFKTIGDAEYVKLFSVRKNILLCGRLNAWKVKGLDIAFEVFSHVVRFFPDLNLDIAGEGHEKVLVQLSEMAKKKGIQDKVNFLGRIDRIQELYQKYKILILTSRTEGFPMTVSEAMSQGLPCVSFERLASSIIIDSCDGILVGDGDVSSMVKAIVFLLSNEKCRYDYGLSGIRDIERFSPNKVTARWTMLFESLNNNGRV